MNTEQEPHPPSRLCMCEDCKPSFEHEPQAQAGEPLILESAADARADREHAEKYYQQAERLLTANERTLHEVIAKKDAALDACVEAMLELMNMDVKGHRLQDRLQFSTPSRILLTKLHSSINQAKEARK